MLTTLTAAQAREELASSGADPFDAETLATADEIVAAVRADGVEALRAYAERFDGLPADAPLQIPSADLRAELDTLPAVQRDLLERTADRVRAFAEAQRASLSNLARTVGPFEMGHSLEPMRRVGCYVPGGRYPLVSTALMTAIPARVAGVDEVLIASPAPQTSMLAAAAVAGVDAVVPVGGAPVVAALAYGLPDLSPVDMIVGPGNQWVTAAKYLVSRRVRIDMLAGPSELLVIADDTADPAVVAGDLIAQAEHDPSARPLLITTDAGLVEAVNEALAQQLSDLPTADVASASLEANGRAVIVDTVDEAVEVADRAAAEHLQVMTRDADAVAARLRHAGAVFVGTGAAEVFGDYGVGPNHTLPTGGGARGRAGLSVLDFLRPRTWIRSAASPDGDGADLVQDVADFARLEMLEGHARAAERRR